MNKPMNQFYKKSVEERKNALKSINLYDQSLDIKADESVFNNLIENYITTYEVPLGVAPDFLIDGKIYHIPMATEEPSVIAGASHAAKIIMRNGGFKIESLERLMIGQIIFKHVENQNALKNYLEENKQTLFEVANKAHPSIYELGGGLKDFTVVIKPHGFVTLYATINCLDAMGANTINTILEALASYITSDFKSEVLMSILSNLATESLVTASVRIHPNTLNHSETIADDIANASLYASIDPFRGATHNKGVMNGITALMLATGNDTRAIEASAHAYASITGNYLPLTTWTKMDGYLVGKITIPLPLGIIGGSMGILPKVKLSKKILNIQSAKELMMVAACLGLAQNFAALYALTTDGINKGHMRLHARNVAIQAGALPDEVTSVVNHMLKEKRITVEEAKAFLSNR